MSSRRQYLMGGMPQIQPYRDSWEEQAFAEDSAGALGSYIWPPRSYTCSFCRREFRSAQALGGHMNVHRRDRARLKQLPTTPFVESTSHLHHHHNNNNFHSYPSQSWSVMRNSNPNHGVVPQPRVSMVSNQENCGESNPTYISSSIIQESSKHLLWSSSPSQSRTLLSTTLGLKIEGDSLKLKEMIGKRQRDSESKEEDHEEEMGRRKRQRIAYASINFLDLDPEEDHQCSEVIIERNRDPVEDIDLELRLGDSRN